MAETANGGYHAIGIDHGFSFGDKNDVQWALGGNMKDAMKTSRKDAEISFSDGIKNFDENKYRDLAKKNGMEDYRTENFISRVKEMQNYGEQNRIKKWKLSDFANFIKSEYLLSI